MNIKINLYEQWIDSIKQELKNRFGGNIPNYANPHEYAIDWQSWNRRLVRRSLRTLSKANQFQCPSNRTNGLNKLENVIVCGHDLTPWLSMKIRIIDYEDAMLNDWGIHHLHLGENLKSDGFIEGTDELLFAIFNDNICFEIGIYKHGDWSEIDLLEIINSNWPEIIEKRKLKGTLDISYYPKTRDEVLALRKANISYMLKLSDGSIIMPIGGGVMTDGTSTEAVLSADYCGKVFRNAEENIKKIITENISQGKLPDESYDFELQSDNQQILAVDEKHQLYFKIK